MSVIVRCSIADNNKYQQYMTIKQGHHRPAFWWTRIRPHFGIREMTRIVTFDSSCHYDWKAPRTKSVNPYGGNTELSDYDHWNKLFGWSDFFGKNSIRVGWRPHYDNSEGQAFVPEYMVNPKVWLGAYLKEDGKRTTHPPEMSLGYWNYGEELDITIEHITKSKSGPGVLFIIYGEHDNTSVFFKYTGKIECGWLMHPYFGGFPTAPHDMELNIQ